MSPTTRLLLNPRSRERLLDDMNSIVMSRDLAEKIYTNEQKSIPNPVDAGQMIQIGQAIKGKIRERYWEKMNTPE